jgi:hypothetical protein
MKEQVIFFALKRSFMTIIFVFVFTQPIYGLKVETHRLMDIYITNNQLNGFALDDYLKGEFNFKEGIYEIFENESKSQEVYKWLGEGGVKEDDPFAEPWKPEAIPSGTRWMNHFHNPIENSGYLTGNSAVDWAFMPQGSQGWISGDYSWYDVRGYFYNALTATDELTREENFADTFRGLGQLMHMIQDMSVPEHARDDGHLSSSYEAWLNKEGNEKNINILNDIIVLRDCDSLNDFIQIPIKFFDSTALISPNSIVSIPVANLFDNNKYVKPNPNPILALNTDAGLSEYTCANFLSPNTIFSNRFPYPKVILSRFDPEPPEESSLCILPLTEQIDPIDGETEKYYSKCKHGEYIKYFLKASLTYEYLDPACEYASDACPVDNTFWSYLLNDDRIFANYAQKLIPRAVGYSAQLLEYFFRGELKVISLPIFHDNEINSFMLNIKNTTQTKESLSSGHFSLVVRYRPEGGKEDGSDDIFVKSNEVESGEIQYDQGANFQFYLLDDIPIDNLESAQCMLAFKGKLGNEEGAVIGKSFAAGTLKAHECWDNGLQGNYPWFHSTADQNLNNGVTTNTIEEGILAKTNARDADQKIRHINQSLIYFIDLDSGCQVVDGNSPNGILITPDTYLQFKIDDLSINQQPPAKDGYTTAYQYLQLEFNAVMNGQQMNNFLALEFTQPGQQVSQQDIHEAIYSFQLGAYNVANIYQLFERQGITITEPFYLQCIELNQQLEQLDEPSAIEHCQNMAVDFVGIVESNNEKN